MSSRLSFVCAALLLFSAGPALADTPSPLDLVRGLREAGMADLALDYIKEAQSLTMPDDDRKALLLERAKCLLEMAEDEPDEGTRTSMVSEAKEAFQEFRDKNKSHPRVSEASIALARLTSIDAKIQLNRARRMEVGDDSKLQEEQAKESNGARVLFILASKRFAEAAVEIKAKQADPTTNPALKKSLEREAFDAELAAAVNLYLLADTYLGKDANTTIERAKRLDEARGAFAKLAGSSTSRTAWIARAWMAETLMDQNRNNDAEVEFKAILASNLFEADEGKRMVRFFQARRTYLGAIQDPVAAKLIASERELRNWLARYGGAARLTPEAISVRYYLAFTLQVQADISSMPKGSTTRTIGAGARRQYDEAERFYRVLTQSDNDYTSRASKNRMHVVRMLVGEAEKPVEEYYTFENAQMAALIQMAKLSDAEKLAPVLAGRVEHLVGEKKGWHAFLLEAAKRKTELEVKWRKLRILALLERARELATDKDSAGDVADNLLRLVYFYQLNNQPFQAAVLGEHVAHTVKSTGGKASLAGLLGVNGYVIASNSSKVDASDPDKNREALATAELSRKLDRDHAIALARFLDEKFPNDQATDAARHRLASMLVEDRKLDEAFEVVKKIRAGYAQAWAARLLEGYIANALITSLDMKLPPGGKTAVYRTATADLDRVVRPVPSAKYEEVKGYLQVRARLASLYLAQSRVEDKALDNAGPGYERALRTADELINLVPTFDCFKDSQPGQLNPKGLEMFLLGMDARTRAIFLRGRAMVDAKQNWDQAAAAIGPAVEDVEKTGAVYDQKMKDWAGTEGDDEEAKAKRQCAALAQGIDRNRREIIMVGFKLRVRQGKPDEASKMLDLLVKAGGSIEENQPTLEFMARDLAVQIPLLKKSGQVKEAKDMSEGLAILLKRLSSVPKLAMSSVMFLGQTLYLVEEYDAALKEFAKAPVPTPPIPLAKGQNWWDVDLNKLENNPAKKTFQEQIRDYRLAQLFTARSLRGLKKFDEAAQLLAKAITLPPERPGAPEKPGFASGSIDYRKELALVHENKAATIADAKQATTEWGKALKEWATLFGYARNDVSRLKDATPERERQAKSRFFDAFLDYQNCVLQANMQVLKGNPKLADTFNQIGKKIFDLETANKLAELEKKGTGIIISEVWTRYCDLLDKHPELKNAYKTAGGKFFLERPAGD